MPAWWKRKSKSSSNSSPGSRNKEAAAAAEPTTSKSCSAAIKKKGAKSFDEAVSKKNGNFHAGVSPFVFDSDAERRCHPLPRPGLSLASPETSLPHDHGAVSASASSVSSSGSSEETPDLGCCRSPEPFNMPRTRCIMPESHRQQYVAEDWKLFPHGPVLEHERLPDISICPRKEYSFDASSNGNAFAQVGASKSVILNPLSRTPGPGFRGYTLPTSPVHPKTYSMTPGSPLRGLNDLKSSHPLPLPPGSPTFLASHSLQSQWKKGKLIGRGTFGNVYEGFNSESGQMSAIKEVKLISDDSNSKECLKQLAQEITLLSQLSHPNIVRYFGSEMGEDALSVYLEYVSGGSIHKLLQQYGAFREPVIRSYARQILAGLAYLHGRNTVHRDIKGANILVDPNGEIKLADFGMAKHISSFTSIRSFRGSPYWMAPEVIMNTNGYNLSVDIWSLGCTILEMATSKPPWSQYEGVAAIFKIGNSKDIPEIPDHISNDGKSFLRLCLQRDPLCRATAAQLMEHPFVRDQPTIKLVKADLGWDAPCNSPDGTRPLASTMFPQDRRSTSPLHERNNWLRHTIGFSPTLKSPSEMVSMRTNMSLPVSPCSSPLRQLKQSNWGCLPSPPHPAFTVGNFESNKSYKDPWPDIFHMKAQTQYGSPRR